MNQTDLHAKYPKLRRTGATVEDVKDAIKEAAKTGEAVEITTTVRDCDGTAIECSFDRVILLMTPTGDIDTRRVHCH